MERVVARVVARVVVKLMVGVVVRVVVRVVVMLGEPVAPRGLPVPTSVLTGTSSQSASCLPPINTKTRASSPGTDSRV